MTAFNRFEGIGYFDGVPFLRLFPLILRRAFGFKDILDFRAGSANYP